MCQQNANSLCANRKICTGVTSEKGKIPYGWIRVSWDDLCMSYIGIAPPLFCWEPACLMSSLMGHLKQGGEKKSLVWLRQTESYHSALQCFKEVKAVSAAAPVWQQSQPACQPASETSKRNYLSSCGSVWRVARGNIWRNSARKQKKCLLCRYVGDLPETRSCQLEVLLDCTLVSNFLPFSECRKRIVVSYVGASGALTNTVSDGKSFLWRLSLKFQEPFFVMINSFAARSNCQFTEFQY